MRLLLRIRFVSLVLVVASACVSPGDPEGPPFRANVLTQVALDPESGRGEFAVERRELRHVNDLDALKGPFFRFYRGGELRARTVSGSLVVDGAFRDGEMPSLRYITEGGAVVARDYPTLVMLSSAYAFGQTFDAIERVDGISAEALVERLGRFDIFFEPVISLDETRATLKRNAFFNSDGPQFGLARRSSAEAVPLAVDAKVLSHEMGHAIFFVTVVEGRHETCDPAASRSNRSEPLFPGRFDHDFALRGLNEGFADFHAFAMTGSVDPLANVPSAEGDRRISASGLDYDDLVSDVAADEDEELACDGAFYCVGTLFARSLYAAYVDSTSDPRDAEQRAAFMRELVRAATEVPATLRARDSLPLPDDELAECESTDELRPESDGRVIGAMLDAFLANLRDELRPALCAELIARFGDLGFPNEYRRECPGGRR